MCEWMTSAVGVWSPCIAASEPFVVFLAFLAASADRIPRLTD